MSNVVVVGLQWGDEGKGKIIDVLAEFADLVVRFQGGANAGHTIGIEGREPIITHLVPTGALRPGKQVVIGPGMVVDPAALIEEIDMLQGAGFLAEPGRLLVSDRAHMVRPYHKLLDRAREAAKGDAKIGTTLRGIGPCLEDKAARSGVRLADFLRPEKRAERIGPRLQEINAVLDMLGQQRLRLDDVLADVAGQAARLEPFAGDAGLLVRRQMARGRNILFEGAQGALLDIDHGTYPFVTSSNTLAAAACTSLGFGPRRIDCVVGVAKAYTTRVGAGPFPTEMEDDRGEMLRRRGGEFGATTGRPRRCGWLDLAALRHAVELNGVDSLCLTKLDVVGGVDRIQLCTGYRLQGEPLEGFPATVERLQQVEPEYEQVEGWPEDDSLGSAREFDALAAPARRYVQKVQAMLNVPVDMISVGPGRNDTILLNNPFRRS